jgi:hypothetical protein
MAEPQVEGRIELLIVVAKSTFSARYALHFSLMPQPCHIHSRIHRPVPAHHGLTKKIRFRDEKSHPRSFPALHRRQLAVSQHNRFIRRWFKASADSKCNTDLSVGYHTSNRSTNLALVPSPIRQAVTSVRGTSLPQGDQATYHHEAPTRQTGRETRCAVTGRAEGALGACDCATGCMQQPSTALSRRPLSEVHVGEFLRPMAMCV